MKRILFALGLGALLILPLTACNTTVPTVTSSPVVTVTMSPQVSTTTTPLISVSPANTSPAGDITSAAPATK